MSTREAKDELRLPTFNYRIVADLAHELRNPIGGIMGMNELLMMTVGDDDQRVFCQSIDNSGKNLLSMLLEIVQLAKYENEPVALTPMDFATEDLFKEIETMLTPQMVEQRVGLKFSQNKVKRLLNADRVRIVQILSCLIRAASKYIEAGDILIAAKSNQKTATFTVTLPDDTCTRDGRFIFEQILEPYATTKRFDMTWVRLRLASRLLNALACTVSLNEHGLEFTLNC